MDFPDTHFGENCSPGMKINTKFKFYLWSFGRPYSHIILKISCNTFHTSFKIPVLFTEEH